MAPSSRWGKDLRPIFQPSQEGKGKEILNLAAKDVKWMGPLKIHKFLDI